MKKNLLFSALLFAVTPLARGYIVEIPSLQIGEEYYPRSVYSKILLSPGVPGSEETLPSLQVSGDTPVPRSLYSRILINAGTPASEETLPSLQVSGESPVPRSVYSKISVGSDSYTLVSSDPSVSPDLTYSYTEAPVAIALLSHTYTTPGVSGSYTLESSDQDKGRNITYSFTAAPSVALLSHTYTTPGESASYTLVSNNPEYADQTFPIDDSNRQVFVVTEIKDIQTTVEEIESEETGHLTYHPASQSLRANWAESREIRIYSVSGQCVKTGRLGGAERSLSVSELPTGVYVVIEVSGGTPQEPLKFLKQ